MANIPYGILVQEIVDRYPVRNSCWHYDEKTNQFSTEISDLRNGLTDPWNRSLPPDSSWAPMRDAECEIVGWMVLTTVGGIHVELSIIND